MSACRAGRVAGPQVAARPAPGAGRHTCPTDRPAGSPPPTAAAGRITPRAAWRIRPLFVTRAVESISGQFQRGV